MGNNTNYYPPVGFYFGVSINGFEDTIDAEFQSVAGLSFDIETEDYAEGGENRFKHKLPIRTKFPNLVLKRGLVVRESSLSNTQHAKQQEILAEVHNVAAFYDKQITARFHFLHNIQPLIFDIVDRKLSTNTDN